MAAPAPSPFQTHGVASGAAFTDRATEVARIVSALRTPGDKLLVEGERRMGKTSALALAAARAGRHKIAVIQVDCSVATSLTELATLIVDASIRVLGRTWKDVLHTFVTRLTPGITTTSNPATGAVSVRWDVALRDQSRDGTRLGEALDALETLARERRRAIAIVLDEFQQLAHLGGNAAEWQFRGIIQRHSHVSYVLAGSETHLIRRMTGQHGALYRLLRPLTIGPIEPEHFARWIDERLRSAGVRVAPGSASPGAACVALAGPRTFDVVLLAQQTLEEAMRTGGRQASPPTVADAFAALVAEQAFQWSAVWGELTTTQQAVLRAVAAAPAGLTTAGVLSDFALGSSSKTVHAARALVGRALLVRATDAPTGYRLDNPIFRGWVVRHALPALGRHLPTTYLP